MPLTLNETRTTGGALTRSGPHSKHAVLSKLSLLAAIGRRAGPKLLEAMAIPAVLFYTSLQLWGLLGAYITALAWSYGAIAARALTGRPVSGLHFLVSAGLTGKTLLAVATGSSFLYFAQPVLSSAVMGSVFIGSVVVNKPMIRWLAADFVPMDDDAAGRRGMEMLFRRLTFLWGGVILLKGATTLVLLLTLSLPSFVLIRTLAIWGLTFGAIAATFVLAFRTANAEALVPVSVTDSSHRFVLTCRRCLVDARVHA